MKRLVELKNECGSFLTITRQRSGRRCSGDIVTYDRKASVLPIWYRARCTLEVDKTQRT